MLDVKQLRETANAFDGRDYGFDMSPDDVLELLDRLEGTCSALEGLLDIIESSTGIAGWHMNGEVAEWGEFEEVSVAYEALAKARGES